MGRSSTSFKPGESGNPGGRPRTKPLTDALRALLDLPPGKDPKPENNWDVAAQAWFNKIRAGDLVAMKEALNRLEGKVADKVEIQDGRVTKDVIEEALEIRARRKARREAEPRE